MAQATRFISMCAVVVMLAMAPHGRAMADPLVNNCRFSSNVFACEFEAGFTATIPAGQVCTFAVQIEGFTRTFITGNGRTNFYLQSYHGDGTITGVDANGAPLGPSLAYHQVQQDRVVPVVTDTGVDIYVTSSGRYYVPAPGALGAGPGTTEAGRITMIYHLDFATGQSTAQFGGFQAGQYPYPGLCDALIS
jgi:hypothetical protein